MCLPKIHLNKKINLSTLPKVNSCKQIFINILLLLNFHQCIPSYQGEECFSSE